MSIPERPIVFLHVPKAAGSTVREQLKVWFPKARHIQFTSPEAWDGLSDEEIARYDVFTGHIGFRFVARVENPILLTFLRDPLERAISQFYYHRNNLGTHKDRIATFWDYLHSDISGFREVLDNGIVWQFAWDQYLRCREPDRFPDEDALLRAAMENFRRVHFVGFQESMDADLHRLAHFLGRNENAEFIPPANETIDKPSTYEITATDKQYFETLARLDIRFVAEAKRMQAQAGLSSHRDRRPDEP